ncbi:uncharacterized protein LOC109826789 [Asparagus officinalis]|uniref:uncharacterized protein LOC109826789 n=1 Tax=Asparagus officinalis TaxID=4686 RepID=UPI00098DE56F|nr:uncharacterized protein LOC109826789 [Asparagus officinalis]
MSNAIHDVEEVVEITPSQGAGTWPEEIVEEVVEITPSQGAGTWPEEIELYFIDLMKEEVKKGNRHTTTFTRTSWKFIEDELKKKSGKEYPHEQLKNKFNQLRQRWRNLKSLLTDTAVGYTVSTGQISATEDVWKNYMRLTSMQDILGGKGAKVMTSCALFLVIQLLLVIMLIHLQKVLLLVMMIKKKMKSKRRRK